MLEAALARLVPQWDTSKIENVTYLEGGYSNDNYRISYLGHDYALRIPLRSQPFVDRNHEHQWLTKLPSDMSVAPVAYDIDSGTMLTNWIKGDLLGDAWGDQASIELIDYLLQLHQTLPDAERSYDLTVYGVEPKTTSHVTTCHNDLNPWNIIISDSGWKTLDWEFVGYNDPLFDLVGLHQGLELPESELVELGKVYLDAVEQAFSQNRLDACIYNFWLREHAWAKYQLDVGNVRPEIEEQLQVAESHLRQ